MVLDGKSSQEYPVNSGISHGYIRGPALFALYTNDLPDVVICDVALYASMLMILLSVLSVIRHLICNCN